MKRIIVLSVSAAALTFAAACGDNGSSSALDGAATPGGDPGGGFVIKPKDAAGSDGGPAGDIVSCAPNALSCLGPTTSATCNPAGTGYAAVKECPTDKICRPDSGQCLPPFCEASKVACLDQLTYHTCTDDGSQWGEALTCPPEYLCAGDECVYERCMGHVLLVVDRSGSMFPHWQSVLKSITTLIADNPKARFGLVGFPVRGTDCGVRSAIEVPLAPDDAASFIGWFASNEPRSYTPLLAAMTEVAQFAPALFEGVPGTIVVLSDGVDTCDVTVVPQLAAIASDLWTQHEIQTYAIGYAFEGDDTSQLDAMAANGGTAHATHIAAGDEAELTNAFKGIVQDFKLCF